MMIPKYMKPGTSVHNSMANNNLKNSRNTMKNSMASGCNQLTENTHTVLMKSPPKEKPNQGIIEVALDFC